MLDLFPFPRASSIPFNVRAMFSKKSFCWSSYFCPLRSRASVSLFPVQSKTFLLIYLWIITSLHVALSIHMLSWPFGQMKWAWLLLLSYHALSVLFGDSNNVDLFSFDFWRWEKEKKVIYIHAHRQSFLNWLAEKRAAVFNSYSSWATPIPVEDWREMPSMGGPLL